MFWLTKFFTKGKTVKDAIKYFHTINGRMPNNIETIKIKNAFMEQNRSSNVIDMTSRLKDEWWKQRSGFKRQHPEVTKKVDEDPTSAMYDRHIKEIEGIDKGQGMGFYREMGDIMKKHRREELELEYHEMFNKILEKAKRIETDPKVLLEAELGTKLTGKETTTQLLDLFSKRPKKASGGIARVGMLVGGPAGKAFLEFIEKLFIKASNDIRLGKGKWAGLDQKQKMVQHDNLVKKMTEWQKTKQLPEGMEQYFGIDAEKAFTGATKKFKKQVKDVGDTEDFFTEGRGVYQKEADEILKQNKGLDDKQIMQKAYDEIKGGSGFTDDYKMDADLLAEEYAKQKGVVYTDLPQDQISKYYDPALKRVQQDTLKRIEARKALKDVKQKIELQMFDTKGKTPHAEGGIAGELHLNRPGYGGGKLVLDTLFKLLKGAGKKKDLRGVTGLYKHIDMEKLMKGKEPITVYSGSMKRPSNTWQSFKETAKDLGTTPEKIAKDNFKDQWFTPFKSYADAFSSPKYLESKLRSVDLTPKEIGMAKRYVEKINKTHLLASMRKKLKIDKGPLHSVTTDDNLVLIPRYKLKELEKSGRMKTDYMILEKLKKKMGLAKGGIAGELHLNEGGRARFQNGALAAYQQGQNILGPYDVSQYEASGKYSPGDLEFLSRTQIPTEAPEWFLKEVEQQKQNWDPSWGPFEHESWEDMQEEAKVHMMRELGPYHEMEFTNPNAVRMPPVGPVPPAGLMMTQGMGPIPIDPNLTPEQWASMQPTAGPMAPVATPQKTVTRNPLVDPRMYRSYAENVQLMGDPRGRAAKGGRIGYAKGTKKLGEGMYNPVGEGDWLINMPKIDPNLRKLMEEYKKRKGLAEILGV